MRQPKFKSWPAWHKRLQLAIHLEYARAPFFFSGDQGRPHRNLQAGNRVNRGKPSLSSRTAPGMAPTTKPITRAHRREQNRKLQMAVGSAAPYVPQIDLTRDDENRTIRSADKQTRTSGEFSVPRLRQGFLDDLIPFGIYALSCYLLPGRSKFDLPGRRQDKQVFESAAPGAIIKRGHVGRYNPSAAAALADARGTSSLWPKVRERTDPACAPQPELH